MALFAGAIGKSICDTRIDISVPPYSTQNYSNTLSNCTGSVSSLALAVNVFPPLMLRRMDGVLRRFLYRSVSDPLTEIRKSVFHLEGGPDGIRKGSTWPSRRVTPRVGNPWKRQAQSALQSLLTACVGSPTCFPVPATPEQCAAVRASRPRSR